jgi:hypothetical protein
MVAAFFGCSCFLACFGAERRILAGPRVRHALPPSAAPVLRAPFRSGPTHVV